MITDELRERIAAMCKVSGLDGERLYAIADRIDEQHAVKVERLEKYRAAVDAMLKEYVKLPVDADGVPIHIGDELDVGFVARIVITDDEWPPYLYAYKETPHILTQHFCNEVSHYHAPTVEDVLREFAEKITDSQIPNVHPTYEEAIAEYASKLRLAGEDA